MATARHAAEGLATDGGTKALLKFRGAAKANRQTLQERACPSACKG
jgi:hypothetical protein